MPIKVLVISNYTDYHSTRPEASIFIGLAKLGFDIRIMTYIPTGHQKEFEEAGIKVIDFHPRKKNDRVEIKRIRDYVIQENIDIMHLFNSQSSVAGIAAAKGLPVKVLLYRGYEGNFNWWDPTAYRKYLHPRVDKIFCNSIGVEDYLKRQLIFGKDKAVTINKGHDVAWYQGYEAIDIRKELGLAPDTFLMVNVANNRRMKGIPYLLEAMNHIPADAKIHLLLVGRNMDSKKNRSIIAKGPNADKVHFLGFRTDVLNIVKACDTFVLSSLFGESITKSVIEAMSLGIAPIITDFSGNVELVEDGVSGLVVPKRNGKAIAAAVLKLYQNPEMRNKMGKAATAHIAKNLNEQNTILKTKELYESVLR